MPGSRLAAFVHELLGSATLELRSAAPRVGHPVEGRLRLAREAAAGDTYKVRLVCRRHTKRGSTNVMQEVHSEERKVRAVQDAQGWTLPFRFEIPPGLPPHQGKGFGEPSWRIEFQRKDAWFPLGKGVDLEVAAGDQPPAPETGLPESLPASGRMDDPFFWAVVKERLGFFLGALGILATFGAVGFFAGYVVVTTVRDGYRAESWPQVPAMVQGIGEGGATYTYEYRGKSYTSDRLGAFWLGGTSDVDDWDDRMGARLTQALESKTPITAFVNPANPREAMLDHQIRWKLLLFFLPFALGFGGVALFLFAGLMARALGWDSRGDSQPMLKARTREMLQLWGFSILWNAVAFPIGLIAMPDLWAEGSWLVATVVAIFPLIGILMIWGALASTWRVIRDGNPFNPGAFEHFPSNR